jgi:hypothetical protein
MGRFVSQQARDRSVSRLAEDLLAAAAASPRLIGRQDPLGTSLDAMSAQSPRSGHGPGIRPCAEEFGSTAVAAPRQAKYSSETGRRVNRKTLTLGCFGAVNLLIGVTGFVIGTGAHAKIVQISNDVAAWQDQQRHARGQVSRAALAADIAEPSDLLAVLPAAATLRPEHVHYYVQHRSNARPFWLQVSKTRNRRA